MNSFKLDYKFGKSKEDEILSIIKNQFKEDIVKSENLFERYDYKSDTHYYELKSRNNKYEAYPTTLIEKGKVIAKNLIFLFNFTNGLYYIKYDKNEFDTFECKQYVRNKRIDYKDIPKLYYFIPIKNLIKIEKK